MARFYHVEVVRHAADVDLKWVDNLLSHFDVPGVQRWRQGVARKISLDGIYHVALVRRLNRELHLPVSAAVTLAKRLLAGESDYPVVVSGIELRIDRPALEAEVDRRVDEAVEASTRPRRGRPPQRASE
jgi:hypothetical protein